MCDPVVCNFLTKTLCANGGRLGLAELQQHVGLSAKQLHDTLQAAGPQRFLLRGAGGEPEVLALSTVRVCTRRQCEGCERLHLCKLHLMGKCELRYSVCKYSHDINSAENKKVLKTHELSGLSENELRILLLQNDPFLLPDLTSWSVVFIQPSHADPSSDKTHQSKLQLKTDTRSKVEGMISDPLVLKLVVLFEVSLYIQSYCSSELLTVSDLVTEKCKSVHFHLPYRWQIYNGITWNDLSLMEEIEKAYCDPKNSSAAGIDFQTMTYLISSVRRLSTPSSVVHPTFVLTTKWIWYWKNDQGQWTEYGTQGEQDVVNSPSSDILENLYLADPSATVQFQSGLYYYQLNFKEMTQMNISSKTKRQVCRRPKFVSYEEVQRIKERGQKDFSIPNQTCPPYWDQSALPDLGYKEVEISKISSEYQEIKKQFEQTMKSYDVIRVLRIQNPSLWKVFQWHKEQMKRRSGGKEIKEKLLFHGTMNCLVKDICSHNFDWRICGSNGKLYGKGSYFARDASYSHEYCQSEGKPAVMFMARVLVGEYAQGKADYVRPPTKSVDGFQFYDSCVDNVADPSVFVVFEKNQVYPEYLIEYKEVQKKCIVS
ncbi:UNVERIFIED_CONTAM: hypothetical protein H355_009967 [Colinus virginianus]|nr:hypothetical protein H355_009967 [Colinus virginianus]